MGLLILLVVMAVTAPGSLSTNSLSLVTTLVGILAIAALGQLLVVMQGQIDLSIPATMALATAVAARQFAEGKHAIVALSLAVLASLVVGIINGVLVSYLRFNSIIVTLAMNGTVLGVVMLWAGSIFGDMPASATNFLDSGIGWLSSFGILGLIIVLIAGVVLRRTRIGRAFVSAGENPLAATIVGTRVKASVLAAFTLASVLYAVAGLGVAANIQSPYIGIGTSYQFLSIVAVALGGAAFMGGSASTLSTTAGASFLVLLTQYLAVRGFSGGVALVLQGCVLIAAVGLVTGLEGGVRGLSSQTRQLLSFRTRRAPS